MKRILITSTQYPYYGGAATNSYALIKYFRANDIRAAGIFFDNHDKHVDPDGIGGVWRAKDNNTRKLSKKFVIRYLGGEPDIILAKNYAAPIASKELFPKAIVAYMVTGCPHMIKLSSEKISAQRYLKSSRKDEFRTEKSCIKISDLVIPNSRLGRQLLIKHYGNIQKIQSQIDTSMALNRSQNGAKFKDRKYDITFIASNLKRDVKNAKLARDLFDKFPEHQKLIIGNNNELFRNLKNTEINGILPHARVMQAIANSKIVLCTSFYDASPNTIKEAIMCGSNVLLSQNCGWSEIYPKEFVCSDVYNINEWMNKAKVLLNRNIEYDLNIGSDNKELLRKIQRLV